MAGVPDSKAQKDMGARLRAIREALGLTQDEISETMGVVVTTLSGWETGRNQIDIVKLARAADRWGFTTDWVARGDLSSLRRDLGDRIEANAAQKRPARRGRPAANKPPRFLVGAGASLGGRPTRPDGPDTTSATAPGDEPLAPQMVDRQEELAWLAFWRERSDPERREVLRMLSLPASLRARE